MVAQRIDEKDSREECVLAAIIVNKDDTFGQNLAEAVAKDLSCWSPAVVDSSNRVRAGDTPYTAAKEIRDARFR
jgi:hypothetical protein